MTNELIFVWLISLTISAVVGWLVWANGREESEAPKDMDDIIKYNQEHSFMDAIDVENDQLVEDIASSWEPTEKVEQVSDE